ncbi:sulfotransferase domain-containing protein [Glycomyces terrestris]|uniref:Sulfotransferase domain-containing protein n=1 Tax=Glycomyces terrestris TaxID=2493553 RepID=A0A426UUG2_9ACTN|nr:sulfotransferase domain-containing protein [Glycomyces terrestris]RRR97561.1 sulfotransferase domain-containing protein [Glycomyces terrestris]
MPDAPHRYQSRDEDSARWLRLPPRSGDIVISTRSKHGTTWTQAIVALLVLQTPDLGAPLHELSPWVDWLVVPEAEMHARLAAQSHRRVMKTHTPLDGIPLRPDTRYIVAARHPLDAAVSLYHQGNNLDHDRIRALVGAPRPEPGSKPKPPWPLAQWLAGWIRREAGPRDDLDALPGVMHHLGDAWNRRDQPNLLLVHYADLAADLEREMRRIADWLEIEVDPERWPELVKAATFADMKSKADRFAPDPSGVMKSREAFFRRGGSGAAAEVLSEADLECYSERVRTMGPPELIEWLNRP